MNAKARYFLDTNILVYSFDANQPEKQQRTLNLIASALQSGLGVISAQVVQEFLNVAAHKFTPPLHLEDRKLYLKTVLGPLCRVYPDQALYELALDVQQQTSYSFYDCLILAGALRADCQILYSEDFQPGQQVRSLQILNPFGEHFTPRSAYPQSSTGETAP